MKPLELIKRLVSALNKQSCQYCLVGGHAASLYRAQERFTRDVDFAIMANPISASRQIAEEVILKIGLEPIIGFLEESGVKAKGRKHVCLVTSKPIANEISGVVDLFLPPLPWISFSVERAQHNIIKLDSTKIPVITPEDLIVAKCYALKNCPERFQDLDDIKQIFEGVKELDLDYLKERLHSLELNIPKPLRKLSPLKVKK